MKGYILFALALLALLLSSCGGGHSPTAPASSAISSSITISSSSGVVTAGRIVLGVVPVGLKRTAVATADSFTTASVELGTLKTSKAFFFIVRNVGGAPIESLTVSTNTTAAVMTPGYIPVLNTDATSSLQQIAELDITHGSDILNRGFKKALLPYGRQGFTLSFRGVSAGQPFSADFTVGLSAVYVDLTDIVDSTGNTTGKTVLAGTASYNGVTCSILAQGTEHFVGDTLGGYRAQYLSSGLTTGLLSTDCTTAPAAVGAMY